MDDCFYEESTQHQQRSTLCRDQNLDTQRIWCESSLKYFFCSNYSDIVILCHQLFPCLQHLENGVTEDNIGLLMENDNVLMKITCIWSF